MRSTLDRVRGHTFLPKLLPEMPVVVDLGANHGLFTEAMVVRFAAKCWSVEANPTLLDEVARRGAVDVINCAISASPKAVHLQVPENDEASTIHSALVGDRVTTYEVEAVTLSSLLDQLGLDRIHLMKVDIEGMEIDALAGLRRDQLMSIDQCCVEFHDSQGFTTRNDIARVDNVMDAAGFRRLQMSVRDCADVLYVRRTIISTLEWLLVSKIGAPYRIAFRSLRRRFGRE